MVPVFAVFLFWVSEGRGRLEMLLEGLFKTLTITARLAVPHGKSCGLKGRIRHE